MLNPSCMLSGGPEEGQGQKWGLRGMEERAGCPLQHERKSKITKSICSFLPVLNLFSFLPQRAELTSDKDMYLDNSSIEDASGVYPIDDDDYASASGSGKAILRACTCVETHTSTVSWSSLQGDWQVHSG